MNAFGKTLTGVLDKRGMTTRQLSRLLSADGVLEENLAGEDYLDGLTNDEIDDPPPVFFKRLGVVLGLAREEHERLVLAFFAEDLLLEDQPGESISSSGGA